MTTLEKQQSDARLLEGWSVVGDYLSGFRHMSVLRCAEKVGLFKSLLTGSKSSRELAKCINANAKGTELLLNCLVSMKIVVKHEIKDKYYLEPKMSEFFDSSHPHHLLTEIENSHISLDAWMNLDKVIQGKTKNNDYGRILFDGNCHQYKGLQAYNRIQSRPIIEHIIKNFGEINKILDIAGADGYIADLLLKKTLDTQVTIVDLRQALDKCGQIFEHYINNNRMKLVESDARTFDLDDKFDLVMMTEVSELFTAEDKAKAITRGFAHTREGGHLVITKFTYDETDLNIEALTFFSMKMFAKMNGSYLEHDSELESILRSNNIAFEKHYYGDKSLYICKKNHSSIF